jgi:beta-glucosidase
VDTSKLADLSLEEKAALTAGSDVWTVPGIATLGVPPLRMTDGPNGARGTDMFGGSARSMCVPCGTALAATFDPDLVERVGALLGREVRQKRARVLLAPTINLVRSPLYGRTFECYGEDPWLSGRLAAAFISGVQAQGVATTPKHLIGNETEHQRQTIDSVIDERTLREVYLTPFEWAIRHGGSLGVMTSYNRLNGRYCSEDPDLLNGILRDEWGFEGFVVSDWFAAGTTVGSLEGGLDVQMPGPDRFFGAPVARAIVNGDVSSEYLDAIVERRIHLHTVLDAWDDDVDLPELGIEHDDDRALARQAAAAAMVLLENDGLLPLSPDVASVALIGPNAVTAHIMGGGSAQLAAHRRITPARVIGERLGDRLTIEPGCIIDKIAPAIRPDGVFRIEFFRSDDWSGPVAATTESTSGRALWVGEPAAGLGLEPFTARMTGTVTAKAAGPHLFTLIQAGGARVLVDGVVVLDGITTPPPPGEAFFGLGSSEIDATVELAENQTVDVVIEFTAVGGLSIRGVAVGHKPPVPADLFDRAVAAAAAAEVAIVVVGTSSEWETEGVDRASMDLPGEQVALIEAVCAANPRTCVVVNAGAPVTMNWADRPAAVLLSWLGGQEMAPALADILFGDVEPGGRLPVTIPLAIEHTPAFGNFPGESNETRYGEGLLVGYRWYDTRKLAVRYPFGAGQSYTTFAWQTPTITRAGPAACTVSVEVTNTGDRAGTDVVQVYVAPPSSRLFRPACQLAGSAKVLLEPGASTRVAIELKPRSFAYWDPANTDHLTLRERMGGAAESIPSGGRAFFDVTSPGWYIDAGDYEIRLARSVADMVHTRSFAIESMVGPLSGEDSLP